MGKKTKALYLAEEIIARDRMDRLRLTGIRSHALDLKGAFIGYGSNKIIYDAQKIAIRKELSLIPKFEIVIVNTTVENIPSYIVTISDNPTRELLSLLQKYDRHRFIVSAKRIIYKSHTSSQPCPNKCEKYNNGKIHICPVDHIKEYVEITLLDDLIETNLSIRTYVKEGGNLIKFDQNIDNLLYPDTNDWAGHIKKYGPLMQPVSFVANSERTLVIDRIAANIDKDARTEQTRGRSATVDPGAL